MNNEEQSGKSKWRKVEGERYSLKVGWREKEKTTLLNNDYKTEKVSLIKRAKEVGWISTILWSEKERAIRIQLRNNNADALVTFPFLIFTFSLHYVILRWSANIISHYNEVVSQHWHRVSLNVRFVCLFCFLSFKITSCQTLANLRWYVLHFPFRIPKLWNRSR